MLQLLQRLTNALGPSCVVMQQFVLGVLDYSLNLEGPEALSLVEDALLLWLVTLRNAPADARDALRLWPHWVSIMSNSIEHVQSCMMIASSAVLLGQAEFLQVRWLRLLRGENDTTGVSGTCVRLGRMHVCRCSQRPQPRAAVPAAVCRRRHGPAWNILSHSRKVQHACVPQREGAACI